MYSPSIQNLIEKFSKFPTVGPRTAARFVFYLLRQDNRTIKDLLGAIADLKNRIKTCPECFSAYESEKPVCAICADSKRDLTMLCVVAHETDLAAIEKTKIYLGKYFVLGGTVSGLKKDDNRHLRTAALLERLEKDPHIAEIVLAINPTSEGLATITHLEEHLRPAGKKLTKLGVGLPLGGELEYADEETLVSAIIGRK
jgi:recombination protein RecR